MLVLYFPYFTCIILCSSVVHCSVQKHYPSLFGTYTLDYSIYIIYNLYIYIYIQISLFLNAYTVVCKAFCWAQFNSIQPDGAAPHVQPGGVCPPCLHPYPRAMTTSSPPSLLPLQRRPRRLMRHLRPVTSRRCGTIWHWKIFWRRRSLG